MMTKSKNVTIKLPEELIAHWLELEHTTKQSIDYYIRESLFRYLEDIEDYQFAEKALNNRTGITYNSKQASQILKELSLTK